MPLDMYNATKVSAEVTGFKGTVANTANTSKAIVSVGKLSAGASPGGINLPSASLVKHHSAKQWAMELRLKYLLV